MTSAWMSIILSLVILLMNFNIYLDTLSLLLTTHCTLYMLSLMIKKARFPLPLMLDTLPLIQIVYSFNPSSKSIILVKGCLAKNEPIYP